MSARRTDDGHSHDERAHAHAHDPSEHGHPHAPPHVQTEHEDAPEHGHCHGQEPHIDHDGARGHHDDRHGEPHAGHGGHAHGSDHAHPSGIRGLVGDLIHPHGHDTADKVDAVLESSAVGIRALKISLAGMLATAVLQLAVVLVSGSAGLLADTIHNFADALTSVPLWLAFALATRAANRRYTYGYGRAEDVAGVVIVLVILGSALLAAWQSLLKIVHPQPMTNLSIVAVAAVIGFFGNEAVAYYRIRVGNQIGSAALVADGYHARADGLTSLAVLIGVVGTFLGFPVADPLVGLGITIAILLIMKDASRTIWHRVMDAVEPEYIQRLEHAAAHVSGVQSVHDVRARWLGHRIEADLRVVVDSDLPTSASHAIAEQVRHVLFHEDPKIATIVVHTDPCEHAGVDHHALTAGHTARAGRTG